MLMIAGQLAKEYGYIDLGQYDLDGVRSSFWGNRALAIERTVNGCTPVIVKACKYILPIWEDELDRSKRRPNIEIDMHWGKPRLSIDLPDGTFCCLTYRDGVCSEAQAFGDNGLKFALSVKERIDNLLKPYKRKNTLKRYHELNEERNTIDILKFDCFFAFSNEQFAKGAKNIRQLREGEKYVSLGAGCYGTKDGADRLLAYYAEVRERIEAECNPQEIYDYEYGNYECMIAYDGDLEAMRLVASIWGNDVAKLIKRKSAFYSLEHLFENGL